jgi:FtsP/CotA-like multicopper oxidase with cupredoxin domain
MNKELILPTTLFSLLLVTATGSIKADALIQCPNDTTPDAVMDIEDINAAPLDNFPGPEDTDHNNDGIFQNLTNTKCQHLSGSEGFITMADGYTQFMFGFGDITGIAQNQAQTTGILNARLPASRIVVEQGQQFYLTLTNAGFVQRPDLFDPHTIHYHGFANVPSVFDGVPEMTFSINPNASLTYFYNQVEPGTYMYHCHVESTEHMQMGMNGNLYVHAAQDQLASGTLLGTHTHNTGDHYAYNDQDGDTLYHVEFPVQIHTFDPDFHDASLNTQPLPFAEMDDKYPMLNGRGYPDTVNTSALPAPSDDGGLTFLNALYDGAGNIIRDEVQSQPEDSVVTADSALNQKILLRLTNMSVTGPVTLTTLGLDMRVIGRGAKMMRTNGNVNGTDISYVTNTLNIGPGEGYDVIIDSAGVTPGTYFLYTTNLDYLSNNNEDYGGIMTSIVIN